jgi:hypothetical protein
MEARPPAENRHGGAPRGERVPPDARRASVSADRRAPKRATTEDLRLFGAPLAPHGADGKETSKTRAQQRAAGTKKTALFDIVNRNYAATRSGPGRARASARLLPELVARMERSEIRESCQPHHSPALRCASCGLPHVAAHISFSAFRLACPSLPTIRWSCTAMPSGRAMSTIALVISMSAREGDGSPEG